MFDYVGADLSPFFVVHVVRTQLLLHLWTLFV